MKRSRELVGPGLLKVWLGESQGPGPGEVAQAEGVTWKKDFALGWCFCSSRETSSNSRQEDKVKVLDSTGWSAGAGRVGETTSLNQN